METGKATEDVKLLKILFNMTSLVVGQSWARNAYPWKDAHTSTGKATAP